MLAQKRLFMNSSKDKVVEQGSKEAAFLMCCEGQEIPKQYEHLVTGAKEQKAPENKERKHKQVKVGGGK